MTKTIAREELARRIQSGTAPILLEALPERYFNDKHLPGAHWFPHDRVGQLAPALLPDQQAEIVVYCASSTCQNSHIAAQRLVQLGYANVSSARSWSTRWSWMSNRSGPS